MNQSIFDVKGMHCASCSQIISKRIKKLPGIESCNVNFATEKASISFDPEKTNMTEMNSQINKLGYSLSEGNNMQGMSHSEHMGLSQTKNEKLAELKKMRRKLFFVLPATIFTFIFMMWDISSKIFPIPAPEIPMRLSNAILFFLSTLTVLWVGKPFIDGVTRFIRYRAANMETLIGLGTLIAYFYSCIVFIFPEVSAFFKLPEYVYFDVVIVVMGFVTLGKYLEAKSKLKTGESIEKLIGLQAKTAIVKRDGKEVEIPISEVILGDLVVVKPGSKIPTDGVIVEGNTSIDESMINGEPIPQDKKVGDNVIGSTINKQGNFVFKATRVGSDTMLAQIIKLVEEAQGSKAEIENLADKISSVFVPVVLGIAILSFWIWVTIGGHFLGFNTAFSYGLLAFVGVLVIACPCALGLATPTAIIVGTGKGAEKGILIKNAQALEKLQKVKTIILDKTGTITNGKPIVTDVIELNSDFSKKQIIGFSASVEKKSSHPLAAAVVDRANQERIGLIDAKKFKETEGSGVEGSVSDYNVVVRKPNDEEKQIFKNALDEGKTVISVIIDKKLAGGIVISDTVKTEAKDAIARLKKLGITSVMVTGDNQVAAEFIAKQVGIDEVVSEVMPQDKASIIKKYQSGDNFVAMAGDGINDAPALSQADVGIAMATGTDIAIESADLILLGGDIEKLPQAFKLSKATMKTVRQNLFWAFIYNAVGIPLASGIFYPIFGIVLNPIFAGVAMALSSVSVVTNSLLLKRVRLT